MWQVVELLCHNWQFCCYTQATGSLFPLKALGFLFFRGEQWHKKSTWLLQHVLFEFFLRIITYNKKLKKISWTVRCINYANKHPSLDHASHTSGWKCVQCDSGKLDLSRMKTKPSIRPQTSSGPSPSAWVGPVAGHASQPGHRSRPPEGMVTPASCSR